MAEPELFGIGISTVANFGVALGTVLLAYFTYKSVKASEEQVKLARNTIEKPRILEKIRETLNGIKSEMVLDLRTIQTMDIIWCDGIQQENIRGMPLSFPYPQKNDYHLGIRRIFSGPEFIPTDQFSQSIDRIDKNLKQRHDTYLKINSELSRLENIIKTDGFDKRVEHLLSKATTLSLKQRNDAPPESYTIFRNNSQEGTIPKIQFHNIITSMLIETVLKPLDQNDYRVACLGYGPLTKELLPHLNESIRNQPIQEADTIKRRLLELLEILKKLDESIIADIELMKGVYREKYTLTEKELDPYRGMW
jgi:hypothetical protein